MKEVPITIARGPLKEDGTKDVVLEFEGVRLRFTAGAFSRLVSGSYYATVATLEPSNLPATASE